MVKIAFLTFQVLRGHSDKRDSNPFPALIGFTVHGGEAGSTEARKKEARADYKQCLEGMKEMPGGGTGVVTSYLHAGPADGRSGRRCLVPRGGCRETTREGSREAALGTGHAGVDPRSRNSKGCSRDGGLGKVAGQGRREMSWTRPGVLGQGKGSGSKFSVRLWKDFQFKNIILASQPRMNWK